MLKRPSVRKVLDHFRMWKKVPVTSNIKRVIALLRSPFFEQLVFRDDSFYFVIDQAGARYDFVSSNFDRLTGWSSQHFIDEGVRFTIGKMHPDDLDAIQNTMASYRDYLSKLIIQGDIHDVLVSYNYRFLHADGGYILFRQMTIPLEYSPEGYLTHGFGVIRVLGKTNEVSTNVDLTMQLITHNSSFAIIRQTMAKSEVRLTNRELEILAFLSSGLSSKEIARRLFISEQTVKSHRKHLLEKTTTQNVAELTAYATRLGLI